MSNLRIDIGTGFYQSDSVPFANQRCLNLYPNVPQMPALTSVALFVVEGLRQVATTSSSGVNACRGAIEFQNEAYFVNGDFLYRVTKTQPVVGDPTYNIQNIGSVGGGRGRVSMAENGTQLIIVNDEGDGYIYAPPTFTPITDAGFKANGKPENVVYLDRYFIVSTDEKKAIISAVGDGTNWNAIDFISAEADPDDVVAPFVHRNQLYLLGSTTTEQFQNIGGAGVPFRRVNGFVVPTGCSAPKSVVNVGDAVYWVGRGQNEKAGVWVFTGGAPAKVSTTAIENELHTLSESQLNSIFAYAYSQKGNIFVHFTTPFHTFIYNPVTQRWHERSSEITTETGNRVTERCRIADVVNVFNDLLVGDLKDGRIGILESDIYEEYGEFLISQFTTVPLQDMSNSFSIPEVELLCETGVGDNDTPDPKVRMEISRDGVQWENPRTRSLGARGDRSIRPIWYKNGRISAQAALRFTVSDAVDRKFYAVDVSLKRGVRGMA